MSFLTRTGVEAHVTVMWNDGDVCEARFDTFDEQRQLERMCYDEVDIE